jgi:hypothetical protein
MTSKAILTILGSLAAWFLIVVIAVMVRAARQPVKGGFISPRVFLLFTIYNVWYWLAVVVTSGVWFYLWKIKQH